MSLKAEHDIFHFNIPLLANIMQFVGVLCFASWWLSGIHSSIKADEEVINDLKVQVRQLNMEMANMKMVSSQETQQSEYKNDEHNF